MNKAAFIILAITTVSYIALALLRQAPPRDPDDQQPEPAHTKDQS